MNIIYILGILSQIRVINVITWTWKFQLQLYTSVEKKVRLQKQLNDHLVAAEKGYDRLREDIKACKERSHLHSCSD